MQPWKLKTAAHLLTLLVCQSAFAAKFTIPVLPDTQCELSGTLAMFTSQMNWIAANKTALNIPMTISVGDVVNWDTTDHYMYVEADAGYAKLDNVGMPYAIAVGNHDTAAVQIGGSAAPGDVHANLRNTTMLNSYFPVSRYTAQQGRYETGKSDNAWYVFTAGGLNWMVVTLECWARQGAVDWAKTVVASHPHHNVIIVTHAHLNGSSNGTTTIQQNNGGYGDLSAQSIYDQLMKQYANIVMVLSGHVDSSASLVGTGVNGNKIYQILQDYQTTDQGGGNIRLLEIDTAAKTISAKMYSPYYNITKTDFSAFSFTGVNFIPTAPFETESLAVGASSGDPHRILTEAGLSGGEGTILDATAVGDYVTYAVPAIAAGTYNVRVGVKKITTRGIWQLAIGRADTFATTERDLGTPQDEYATGTVYGEVDMGTWSCSTSSDKWFRFQVTGKNAASTGYGMAFDYIKLIPQ